MLNLYDDLIISMEKFLDGFEPIEQVLISHPESNYGTGIGRSKESKKQSLQTWPDAGKNNMILRSDMAFELGGSTKPLAAIGCTLFTEDNNLVPKNSVYLIGKDLPDIREEIPYARITIIGVDGDKLGSGDKLYDNIRKIENTRYRVNPKGFMMRVSSVQNRECVRVSKEALDNGINFSLVGDLFNKAFLQLPQVKTVCTYFITDPSFDYVSLEKKVYFSEEITKTIDHVFKDMTMDCGSCNLKEVCDEVEGLRELHFLHKNN